MSKLREYRIEAGISQQAFADAVGVRKGTISRIENGTRVPSFSLLSRIVAQTNGRVTPNDFLPEQQNGVEPVGEDASS